MDGAKAKELIEKYLNGTCTPEEKLLLERFYYEESAKRSVPADEIEFTEKKEELYKSIQYHIKSADTKPAYTLRRLAVAASFLLILGLSFFFYKKKNNIGALLSKVGEKKEIIGPARQRATLTLSDGTSISLDDAANGTLSNQSGKQVVKVNNGSIVYKNNVTVPATNNKLAYNTMSTPKGGYYHLTLSDGSDVWLNSASSITFPVSFPGDQRIVTITGEAYFEIAKNKNKPFLVKSGDQTITVLGTHFNVFSYKDETAIVTTLLEGSVKIIKGDTQVMLKPGQAAVNSYGARSIKVSETNTDDAVAWKNGYFKFNNENLGSIMKKLSRWYDVDVEFQDNVENMNYWGTYSRSKRLVDLLNDLEQADDVHFKIDGRRIIVMK